MKNVIGYHPFKRSTFKYLYPKNVLNGKYFFGTFRPKDHVTKEEAEQRIADAVSADASLTTADFGMVTVVDEPPQRQTSARYFAEEFVREYLPVLELQGFKPKYEGEDLIQRIIVCFIEVS